MRKIASCACGAAFLAIGLGGAIVGFAKATGNSYNLDTNLASKANAHALGLEQGLIVAACMAMLAGILILSASLKD